MKYLILLAVIVINACLVSSSNIVSARLESCPGCSLNRLDQVKWFAYNDIQTYENVEWKKISGAPPELVFLNDQGEEVERIPLKTLNRVQCNDLLLSRGFVKKAEEKEAEEKEL
ncbi:selenoprotein M-like [Diabrotica virgifera virgifera]|uniref:Selenoprotein M n=1 Tax=Diabrotica virgifera virgifera TaxID=50390 RepID=A0ABM5JY60_DIAVI|nr:selenoprotein M-like [Diabrotica virgifera virgifera]